MRNGTPPREDGDAALQRCQDALYRRLALPRRPARGRPASPLRVFIWTVEAARLAPDVAPAMDLLQAPEDAALLTVGRTEPAARLGRSWYALVPSPLQVLRETFTPPIDARDRAWLLDMLERQVRECFWETAYDLFRLE